MSLIRNVTVRRQNNLILSYKLTTFKRNTKIHAKIELSNPFSTGKINNLSPSEGNKPPTKQPSLLYKKIIQTIDPLVPAKIRPMWEHEAGPKTIFFWAPLMKALLVVASLKDLTRTADKISVRQSGSLAFTSVLWSRWSLIIIPKNYLMFAVNFFVALTQSIQAVRALLYTYASSQKA